MNDGILSLDQLPLNTRAKVINVDETDFANTILTMGLTPNSVVSVIRKSLLGESLYLRVGNQNLAIRSEHSKTISVNPI